MKRWLLVTWAIVLTACGGDESQTGAGGQGNTGNTGVGGTGVAGHGGAVGGAGGSAGGGAGVDPGGAGGTAGGGAATGGEAGAGATAGSGTGGATGGSGATGGGDGGSGAVAGGGGGVSDGGSGATGGAGATGGGGGSAACAPLAECSGECVDLDTSALFCGNCFTSCDANETCLSGHCQTGVGTLVLSELRAQAPALVELYNGGSASLNLLNYQVQWSTDDFGTGSFVLPSYNLAPGEFVVLAEGSGANGPGLIYLGQSVYWISHVAVRLLNTGGFGVDFVRTGGSTVPPPAGTSWNGGNATNPSPWTNQSLIRNVTAADSDTAGDWTLTEESSPASYCPRASQCGPSCLDVASDHDSCGACGDFCGPSQLCLDSQCSAGYVDLWISEYRRSPRAGVEIHNPTPVAVTLTGYRLDVTGPSTLSYVFPAMVLEPGGYLFLYAGTGTADATSRFVGPTAAFGSDVAVALYDDGANPLDFVRFGSSVTAPPAGANWFGGNVTPPDNGVNQAAMRKLEQFDTDAASDWVLSSPGTPGYGCADGLGMCQGICVDLAQDPDHCGDCGNPCGANETCEAGVCRTVGALVLSELRDESNEYFELYNGTNATIDLAGWEVHWNADGGNGLYTFAAGASLAPGQFLRLLETACAPGAGYVCMGTTIQWSSWIAVRILDASDVEVDLVRTGASPVYGNDWIGATVGNPPAGQSIVRDVFAADTDTAADWRSESAATPSRYCSSASESVCGAACVALATTAESCGACGNVCPQGNVCSDGACVELAAVRMVKYGSFNGTSTGRPEMFLNGRWYTLYGAASTPTAAVICRQLGFSGALASSSNSGSCGSTTGCGTLSPATCSGTEALLADCTYTTYDGDYQGYSVSCTAP